jgi:hypothetical protein
MLGKEDFPHLIIITRDGVISSVPPYSGALYSSSIWSGSCDYQIVSTYDKQFVAESTYIVFCEKIPTNIIQDDLVTIIKEDAGLPIYGKIVQSESANIFEDNGVIYGTTIWIRETKS